MATTPFFNAELAEWGVVPACVPPSNTEFSPFHDLDRFQKLSLFRGQYQDDIRATFLRVLAGTETIDAASSLPYIAMRTGSPSKFGEVYIVCIRGVYVACKVMPVTSSAMLEKNLGEVEFARRASDLVERRVCANFPLLYFFMEDELVQVRDPSSLVALRGRLKECRATLLQKLIQNDGVPRTAKVMLQRRTRDLLDMQADVDLTHVTSENEENESEDAWRVRWMKELGTYFNIVQLRIPLPVFMACVDAALAEHVAFHATLMFSELADADVKNFYDATARAALPAKLQPFARTFVTIKTFATMCSQLVTAIQALQDAGICHMDMHLGNVLVLCSGKDVFTPLVHDFGLAVHVAEWSTGGRIGDLASLFKFMDEDFSSAGLDSQHLRLIRNLRGALNAYATLNRTDAKIFQQLRDICARALVDELGHVFTKLSIRAGYAQVAPDIPASFLGLKYV